MMKKIIFAFIFMFATISVFSQERNVSGVIHDENGEPLPGVNIIVKGTSNGTSSDFDGKYSISSKKGDVLEFSFIGYNNAYKTVKDKVVINMSLKPDSQVLQDVVVTGYQKVNRKLFTGSATRVKVEDVKLEGSADITRSLQGQVSGVSVDNVSGTFGAAPIVRIRGNASINGNNKPLWVIDGVVLEDLVEVTADDLTSGNLTTVLSSGVAGLNNEDIESIEILKDVSATALYGARAANGVIVINTKKGYSGDLRVNYTGSVTIEEKPNYDQFDILDSGSEIAFYKELANKNWISTADPLKASNYGVFGKMYKSIFDRDGKAVWVNNNTPYDENFLKKYAEANTDWFDMLFKNSIIQQHSVSLSGGSDKANFYSSVSLYNDNGKTISDKTNRYTATLRGNFDLSEKLKLGLKLSTSYRDQKLPGTKDREFNAVSGVYERDFDINPFSYALNTSRSMRAYDDDGNLEYFRRSYAPFNILDESKYNKIDLNVIDATLQADINYAITDKLSFSSVIQGRYQRASREHKIHEKSNQANAYRADNPAIIDSNRLLYKPEDGNLLPYTILPKGGFYNTVENSLKYYSIRNSLSWDPNVGEDNSMNILVGIETKVTDRKKVRSDGWGILYDRGGLYFEHPDLSKYLSDANQKREEIEETTDRFSGAYIDAAYSWRNKYTLRGSFRYDGSNRLGNVSSAKYLPSWSVSGKWNIGEENFLKDNDAIDYLALKATYGLVGVLPSDASAALLLKGETTWRPIGKETLIYADKLANSDLTWEKLYEFNIGLEAGFFNGRVRTDLAFYKRNSFDLVGDVFSSGVGGVIRKKGNFADLKAHGFEVSVSTVNVQTENFKWTSSLTFDYNTNEITNIYNSANIGDAVSNQGAALKGRARKGLYSFRFAGLTDEGLPTFKNTKGEIIKANVNLQKITDIQDFIQYEGSVDPKYSGGLTNTFKYKGVSLGANFTFRAGNKIRLDDLFKGYNSDYGYSSISKDLNDRWAVPGDENITNVPTILDRRFKNSLDDDDLNYYELYNKSDARIADGSYVKLKSVSLGYELPKLFTKTYGINSAKISLQAQNLWTIYSDSKLNGLDPEFYRSGGVALPSARSYTLTLRVGF